ncbi:MAG: hypothetical protein ABSH08_13935 [Tepidisphaeraceae bacterium]|jgi:hypothetical protein
MAEESHKSAETRQGIELLDFIRHKLKGARRRAALWAFHRQQRAGEPLGLLEIFDESAVDLSVCGFEPTVAARVWWRSLRYQDRKRIKKLSAQGATIARRGQLAPLPSQVWWDRRWDRPDNSPDDE